MDSADRLIALCASRGCRPSGCSRRMYMPTTCRPRPISRSSWAARWRSAGTSPSCRTFRQDLQCRHRVPARRQPVRPAVRGRRPVHARHDRGTGAAYARPHAGLHDLPDRRRRLRRRYAVHARLRHGALRLPGRRCAAALPVDPQDLRAAGSDAAVPVPRLQGARPRRISLGDHGRRGEAPKRACARGCRRGRVRGACAPHATRPSACPS